jgi:glycosyltransferase involved in cell wall biosynthesis
MTDDTPRPAIFLARDIGQGGVRRGYVDLVNRIEAPRPIPVVTRDAADLQEFLREDRPLHVLPGPPVSGAWWLRWVRGPLGLWRRTRGVTELARLTNASAIVSFRHRSHVIAMCARFASRGRIPVVLSSYETLSQNLLFEHGTVWRAFYEWFSYRFFRQANLVIAASNGIAEDLEERFGVPRDRLAVVPKPIDVERVREAAREEPADWPSMPPGAPVILGVGRLVRAKGFDTLVRALSRLGAHMNAHVILVGDGPEAARLEALARSLGVNDRLHRVGHSPNPWAYMSRADVLAVPSRTEGLPDVVNEAHAIGLPIVAAACSAGMGEALEAGAAGVLVPPDDPATLADAITRTLEDGSLVARLLHRGQLRVASLRPETAADQVATLLAEVVEKAGDAGTTALSESSRR